LELNVTPALDAKVTAPNVPWAWNNTVPSIELERTTVCT
jgi:hypothetical protein